MHTAKPGDSGPSGIVSGCLFPLSLALTPTPLLEKGSVDAAKLKQIAVYASLAIVLLLLCGSAYVMYFRSADDGAGYLVLAWLPPGYTVT